MSETNPDIKINGVTISYEPNTYKERKGNPTRNYFPDTKGNINTTEDLTTAVGGFSIDLRSTSANEELFNEWVANNLIASVTKGSLNKSFSNLSVANPEVEIESGSDTTFTVMFSGNPVIE
jgi:hypothetical protein